MSQRTRELFNFLVHYELDEKFDKLREENVTCISHLKATSDENLRKIGYSGPEIDRLRKKLKENFESIRGKVTKRKFAKDTEEWKRKSVSFGLQPEPQPDPLPDPQEPDENPYVAAPNEVLIPGCHIQVEERLGEGAYSSVYRGIWNNNGLKSEVAIKMIAINEVGVLIREYQSLVKLNHPNIIKLYGLSIDGQTMLVEELALGGSLLNHLVREQFSVHLDTIKSYCLQMACGMAYLAKHQVVHRDLATRNILISRPDQIKICDFGMARKTEADQPQLLSLSVASCKVSFPWAAMEILTQKQYSVYSDVWSFGVTMWEMFSQGRQPWKGLSSTLVKGHLVSGNRLGRPSICPKEFYSLMGNCWHPTPQQRPNFAAIKAILNKIEIEKVVSTVSFYPDNREDMLLKKGEIIYVTLREGDGIYGVSSGGSAGFCAAASTTSDLSQATPTANGKKIDSDYAYPKPDDDVDHQYEDPFDYTQLPGRTPGPAGLVNIIPELPERSPRRDMSPGTYIEPDEPGEPIPPRPVRPVDVESHQYVEIVGEQLPQPIADPSAVGTPSSSPTVPSGGMGTDQDQPLPLPLSSQYIKMSPAIGPSDRQGDVTAMDTDNSPSPVMEGPYNDSHLTPHQPLAASNPMYGSGYSQPRPENRQYDKPRTQKNGRYDVPRKEVTHQYHVPNGAPVEQDSQEYNRLQFTNADSKERDAHLGTKADYHYVTSRQQTSSQNSSSDEYNRIATSSTGHEPYNQIQPLSSSDTHTSSTHQYSRVADPRLTHSHDVNRSSVSPERKPSTASNTGLESQFSRMNVVGEYTQMEPVAEAPKAAPRRTSRDGESPGHSSASNLQEKQSRVSSGSIDESQFADKVARIQEVLPSVPPQDCKIALQQSDWDVTEALCSLKVDMLMKMQFAHINPEDCRAALKHCQNKVDRAAAWLLEKSEDLASKRV